MAPSFDPVVLALVLTATALYVRAVLVLRRRGYEVPFTRQLAWHGGMALTAVGLLSPIDGLAEDLLSAHMAQHLLIADLAAPLLVAGMRTPVLVFLLPRPVLVALARRRGLRRAFRASRRPLVALPLFVLVLYAWHTSFMFEAALRNQFVHALQHQSFVVASVLVWWPALEPKRRRMAGELWKIGHILGARLASMFLGMAFIFMRTPAYVAFYGDAARDHGLSPIADQQMAGGMMMTLDILIIMFALAFFFWQAAREYDRTERHAPAPTA